MKASSFLNRLSSLFTLSAISLVGSLVWSNPSMAKPDSMDESTIIDERVILRIAQDDLTKKMAKTDSMDESSIIDERVILKMV